MSFNPPTPTRKALRCRGLRVNRCPAGHPLTAEPSKVRLFGLVRAWGSVRVTLRVLRPDGCAQNPDRVAQNPGGDVRQDISLLVARDTGAQSAKVSRVCDPPGMWCPAGHRFTAPDGVSTHYDTPSRQGVYLCRNSKAVKTIWGAGIKNAARLMAGCAFCL